MTRTRSTYLLGTRGSALARTQAEVIRQALTTRCPHVAWDLVTVTSKADERPATPLAQLAGEGIFVKELEQALLRREIDVAVHSLKDIPLTGSPAALMIGAIPARETPYDALVSREGRDLARLPGGARVGSSSLRRQSQLLHLRPDLQIVAIRGNVDTRLRKIEAERLDAVVVAAAGLIRLGLRERITELLTDLVPEPGQGALAVQVRRDDRELCELVQMLEHPPTRIAVETERALLAALGGGCRVPIGALAELHENTLRLTGVVASPDGKRLIRDALAGSQDDGPMIASRLAGRLKDAGALELLAAAAIS